MPADNTRLTEQQFEKCRDMTKISAFVLNLNDCIQFSDDDSLPQDIRNQHFKVTKINTILVNDFYFNHDLFACYELTDSRGSIIRLSPFHFEADNHTLRLRITKQANAEDLLKLFHPLNPFEVLSSDPDESDYFLIEDSNVSKELKNWLGRTYYPDVKDQEMATITYIDYDSGNKKNLNYSLLLKKYPHQPYLLFLGDYNTFYLERNKDNMHDVLVTTFLDASVLTKLSAENRQAEKV